MSEATPRQILYALVAAGFVVVVIVLTIGAAIAGLVPTWWTVTLAGAITVSGGWIALQWQKTGLVLVVGIGLFLVWLVGTLMVAV